MVGQQVVGEVAGKGILGEGQWVQTAEVVGEGVVGAGLMGEVLGEGWLVS